MKKKVVIEKVPTKSSKKKVVIESLPKLRGEEIIFIILLKQG